MASITFEGIKKVYPNGHVALHHLDLSVHEGEFMVLVGPSGCGKTTALRMVAGLESVTEGTLRIGDRVVNDLPPKVRDVAMVFQNYALYPHMTVAENIGFALKLRKVPKAEIRRRVEDAAKVLGLTDWLDRKPGQLSGGQRQRVAMGRALVREPSVFLMDEPLSNLDAKLRVQMRAEVLRIQRRLGVTTLYVTHDQTEAMTMGERVAVMRDGVLQQCASPHELFERPANLFVAAFIGSPAMNLFEARITDDGERLQIGHQQLPLPPAVYGLRPELRGYVGRPVVAGIRPEHFELAGAAGCDVLESKADLVETLGSEALVHFELGATRVQTEDLEGGGVGELRLADVAATGEAIARVSARAYVVPGSRLSFTVDPALVQFFDPASGHAVRAHAG